MTTENAVTTTTSLFDPTDYPLLDAEKMQDIKEAIEADIATAPYALFPKIATPKAGNIMFTYNTFETEVTVQEIVGVLLHIQPERAMYIGKYGSGEPPICTSKKGIIGEGDPSGLCSCCPNNQFGNNKEPKPCKESKILYIMLKGEAFPVSFKVSSGSFKAILEYGLKLTRQGIKSHSIETKFTLKADKYKNSGNEFSKLVLTPGNRILDKNIVNSMAKIKYDLVPFITGEPAIEQQKFEQQKLVEAA